MMCHEGVYVSFFDYEGYLSSIFSSIYVASTGGNTKTNDTKANIFLDGKCSGFMECYISSIQNRFELCPDQYGYAGCCLHIHLRHVDLDVLALSPKLMIPNVVQLHRCWCYLLPKFQTLFFRVSFIVVQVFLKL